MTLWNCICYHILAGTVRDKQHTKWPVIESHSKDEIDAWLEEAVSISEAFDFTFTAAQQRTDDVIARLRTSALIHADTQVDRRTLRSLLTPASSPVHNIDIYMRVASDAVVLLLVQLATGNGLLRSLFNSNRHNTSMIDALSSLSAHSKLSTC